MSELSRSEGLQSEIGYDVENRDFLRLVFTAPAVDTYNYEGHSIFAPIGAVLLPFLTITSPI